MAFKINPAVLNSASARLEVIGNNISNASVTGFKSSTFSDVLSSKSSSGGNGSRISGSRQTFKQGTIEASTNAFDMAINGKGFFKLDRADDGSKAFTRDGTFSLDTKDFIVNTSGDYLMGYGLDSENKSIKSVEQRLKIDTSLRSESQTSSLKLDNTLDSRLPVISGVPFNSALASTYSNSTITSIYDETGNSHEFKAFYVRTGDSTWSIYGETDGNGSNMVGTPAVNTPLANLVFGTNGKPTSNVNPINITYRLLPNVAASQTSNFNLDFSKSVMVASDFQAIPSQDGYPSGKYLSVNIDKLGNVIGNYDNGKTKILGQVPLYKFASETNLAQDRSNQFVETSASGAGLPYNAGTAGLGQILGQSIENSDVDLTAEMIKLIAAQRTYQANAEVVKRQDQIMQNSIGLFQ
jgi:flagellar hook protein FlgE